MRVALVVMPFAAADRPTLAAGLLKALLLERGIACECKYFNLTFRSLLGREAYELASIYATGAQAGEWVFSQIYFGEACSSWETYCREILDHPRWGVSAEHKENIQRMRKIAPAFLRIAYESCDWSRYDLVGFTSNFEQTMPGVCLARMIRESHPQVKIAFGGANFEGPMARPYLDLFPEIDYISNGEADLSFPQLCENLAVGVPSVPPGILHRHPQASPAPGEGAIPGPVPLDSLPIPDYDEFFAALAKSPPAGPVYTILEASRGCWWGAKQHCTFCAFSQESIVFRRRSWQRVAFETAALRDRYRPTCQIFADSILAMDYFQTLLPHWAEEDDTTPKFFEIKANLRRDQVAALQKAKVLYVQPGIESLADRMLEVMKKGVSAAQNIALLRWCSELGIRVHWNLIFGFPGEDLEDYPRIQEVMTQLVHLQAPESCGPIRMDRFSPNFDRWRELGFLEIRPLPVYKHIYPLDEEGLAEMAYYYEYKHPHSDGILDLGRDLMGFGSLWLEKCRQKKNGSFTVKKHVDGGWVLVDDRFNRPKSVSRMSPEDLLLLLLCDSPTTPKALLETAHRLRDDAGDDLCEAYERLRAWGAICQAGPRIVTIPLLPDDLRQVFAT
jgi:ribosomal peptide maturation radical SAM protein 1